MAARAMIAEWAVATQEALQCIILATPLVVDIAVIAIGTIGPALTGRAAHVKDGLLPGYRHKITSATRHCTASKRRICGLLAQTRV